MEEGKEGGRGEEGMRGSMKNNDDAIAILLPPPFPSPPFPSFPHSPRPSSTPLYPSARKKLHLPLEKEELPLPLPPNLLQSPLKTTFINANKLTKIRNHTHTKFAHFVCFFENY